MSTRVSKTEESGPESLVEGWRNVTVAEVQALLARFSPETEFLVPFHGIIILNGRWFSTRIWEDET